MRTSSMLNRMNELPIDSVVELTVRMAPKDAHFYYSPWSAHTEEDTKLCTGLIIDEGYPNRRILTCSHCASEAVRISVRIASHPLKNDYEAKVSCS